MRVVESGKAGSVIIMEGIKEAMWAHCGVASESSELIGSQFNKTCEGIYMTTRRIRIRRRAEFPMLTNCRSRIGSSVQVT